MFLLGIELESMVFQVSFPLSILFYVVFMGGGS